jgi:hypothetical protein
VPDVPEVRTGHLYGGALPGCFAAYAGPQGRQCSDPSLAEARMLAVDACMARHPGVPGRQAAQSVRVHLIGAVRHARARGGRARFGEGQGPGRRAPRRLDWLEPPTSLGSTSVFNVLATAAPNEHRAAVGRWAQDVWHAWAAYRPAIRRRTAAIPAGPAGR